MTENTEPSSPSHPAPDPEILKSTIRAMKQSEQRANNVPALIKRFYVRAHVFLSVLLVTPFSTGTQRMWSANISLQTMVVWSGWHQQVSQHGVRMMQWPLAARHWRPHSTWILCTIVHRFPLCLRVFLTKVLPDM